MTARLVTIKGEKVSEKVSENVTITKHTKYSLKDLWIRIRFWLASVTSMRPPFEIVETFTIEVDEDC
jgi:hypothetical protein